MTRRRSSRVCIRTSQSLQRSVLFATSHRRVPALSAVSTPARVIKESIKSIKSFHPRSLTYVAGNHRTPWPPVSPGARTSPWPCRTRAPRTPRGRVRRRCSHHHRASSRARPPSRTPRTVAARSHASPRRHLAHRSRARAPRASSSSSSSPSSSSRAGVTAARALRALRRGAIDRSGLFEDIPIGEVFFVRVFLIHSSHSKILEYGEPGPKMHVRGGWIQTGRVESSSDATGRPRRARCRRAPLSDAVERDGGRTSAYRRDAMDERREGKSRGRARARSTADADGARRAGTERCARADPMNLDADERASRFRIHSMRRRSRSNSE